MSDIIDPSIIISFGTFIASIGAVICGFSKSLLVGSIGRFLVGVGCGPLYSPCNRVLINWFPLEHYSKILGLFNFTAGCGLLLAQTPLTLLSQAIGWRWCFFLIAIISVLLATTYLIFVKGNPVSDGYPAVNDSLIKDSKSTSTKEKMHQLLNNMTTIISNPTFWLLGFFVFFLKTALFTM